MDPLTAFAARLCRLCLDHGIVPIVYGSYLLRALTDEPVEVHDVDVLVREAEYPELVRVFREAGVSFEYHSEHHTLIARDADAIVEFDSLDHYYDGPEGFVPFELGGARIRALPRDGLRHVYEKAVRVSGTPEKYAHKARVLADDRRAVHRQGT